jgi:serine/threonine protein kinase
MLIVCSNCQSENRVSDSALGTKGECHKCGTLLDIPPADAQPVATVLTTDPAVPKADASQDNPSDAATVAGVTPQSLDSVTQLPSDAGQAKAPAVAFPFLTPAQGPDELGRLGPYRILRVLGQGGMGVVFLAEDIRLGRRVALKAMLPELANKPAARERFLREARTAAAIEHDHIVAIYQVEDGHGVPYIAMPLLKGCSLEDWLKSQYDQPQPAELILKLGKQVAQGLAAAHEHGLIHRDIKPANIWLEYRSHDSGVRNQESGISGPGALEKTPSPIPASIPEFRVKILDFGLARSSAGTQNLTLSGVIMGTPAYMAPEQARAGSRIDARADLFSLGVVLYRLATGKLPFKGEDMMGTLLSMAMDTPTSPAALNLELPLRLSDLVMQLLAKDPKDRVGSAEEVVRAIAAIEAAYIAAAPTPPPDMSVAGSSRELPVVQPAPEIDPFTYTLRELPDDYQPAVPPSRRHRRVPEENEPTPRHRRHADRGEDQDDDLSDLRELQKEDTTLSLISMIVGIVATSSGVLAMCCCGGMFLTPVAGVGGAAAIVMGVMGRKRGGQRFAVAGISLGIMGVLFALASLAFLGMGIGINWFGAGGPAGRF